MKNSRIYTVTKAVIFGGGFEGRLNKIIRLSSYLSHAICIKCQFLNYFSIMQIVLYRGAESQLYYIWGGPGGGFSLS